MGAGDLEVLDILITTDDDDQPRLKVGDRESGAGVAQDCAYLASDGFVSYPNPPDDNGAATCIGWTPGNDTIVLAACDGRYNDKAGTLAPGDRAIVSNCDASLKLTKASNKIQLLARSAGVSVTVDGDLIRFQVSHPNGGITLSDSGAQILYTDGANICSITLAPGGAIAIVAPGGLTVNGVPVP